MEYVKRFNTCSDNSQTAIRSMFTREGIKEPEATKFWNLNPQTVEQARALIPALENYPDDVIAKVIDELQ